MAITDKILKRVHGYGRGGRVFTPKDFLDLGSRASVDQALTRLTKAGTLRRVGRGLYDWPYQSSVLGRPAPANLDAVADAVTRRAGVRAVRSNDAAANALGLTNAVATRPIYLTNRKLPDVKVGDRTIRFNAAGAKLAPWLQSDALILVQALMWLHQQGDSVDDAVLKLLRKRMTKSAKAALLKRITVLPGWAADSVRKIAGDDQPNL